jgi:hypothetical protein
MWLQHSIGGDLDTIPRFEWKLVGFIEGDTIVVSIKCLGIGFTVIEHDDGI